jgi:alpha-glucosidase
LAEIIFEYYDALPPGAWPNWVLGNHDNTRIATRIGSRQAWIAAMLLLTLPGTLTMYYGEEIGITNVPIAPDERAGPSGKKRAGAWPGPRPGKNSHAVGRLRFCWIYDRETLATYWRRS